MSFRVTLKYRDGIVWVMTRYSASRGIMYSAPPNPSGKRTDEATEEGTESADDAVSGATDSDAAADAAADD
ncbi:MAG: hypothetical protein ACI8UR_001258 [Natronomonas sp.]|jgi:hypothetical protein